MQSVLRHWEEDVVVGDMALYMKQLVTETEIDLSVRDGRDKKRNEHENSIYNDGNI